MTFDYCCSQDGHGLEIPGFSAVFIQTFSIKQERQFFLPEEFDKHLPGDDDYVFHKEKFIYEEKADALALPIVPMGRSIEKQIFVLRNEGQSPDEKNVRRFSLRGFDFEMPIEPEEDEIEPRLLKCHVNVEMSLFFGNTVSFTYRFLFNGHSGTLSAPVGIDHIIALLSTWLGAEYWSRDDVVASNEIAPKSALVLWYNTLQTSNSWVDASPVDVSSVALGADGYVRFSTPETFVPGNAVIAVFAEEGVTYDSITADENKIINNATLLWSWTIWAADGYDPEATAVNADGNVFMDRNLGAVISGVGSTGNYEPAYAVGNYYQWGRKDPFPSIADYCNYWPCEYVNTLIGTPTYTPIVALRVNGQSAAKNVDNQVWGYRTKDDGSFNYDSSWHTIERNSIAAPSSSNRVFAGYAVEHPYVYILNPTYPDGGYYPWLTTNDQSYREFWGGSESNKTLFDPCPTGWRVCNKAEAESFMQTVSSTAALASNLVGYDFDGHYLPMTGTRGNKNMRTTNVRSCGYETKSYMWTSEILTSHNYGYAYTAAMIAPANYADAGKPNTLKMTTEGQDRYLTLACPVRCVKE